MAEPDLGQEERTASALMGFAVISSLIVLVLIVVFGVVAVRLAADSAAPLERVPYNLTARPVPRASRPGELFPQTMGDFQRQTLTGNIENFRAVYTSGEDRIAIRGWQAVSFLAAQVGVRMVMEQVGPASVTQRIEDADPRYSYYLSAAGDGMRYAWSHERWFFDVEASSRSALDEFMELFQY